MLSKHCLRYGATLYMGTITLIAGLDRHTKISLNVVRFRKLNQQRFYHLDSIFENSYLVLAHKMWTGLSAVSFQYCIIKPYCQLEAP